MIRCEYAWTAVVSSFLAGAAVPLSAQSLDLSWHTIDGGSEIWSSGGNYQIGSTIGQPDVGTMIGDPYTFTGGFWPACTGQSCGCPDPASVVLPPGVIAVDAQACADTTPNGQTWETAFNDLQDALDAAAASGGTITEIWLAQGIYRPSARTDPGESRSATFQLLNGVAVYGGFQCGDTIRSDRNPDPATNGTALSGDLSGDDVADVGAAARCFSGPDVPLTSGCGPFDLDVDGDVDCLDLGTCENSLHVVTASGVDATAILDGVTITAGNADTGSVYANVKGGGVLCDGAGPNLTNLRFSGNLAITKGGAMACQSASSPILTDCVFENNVVTSTSLGTGGGAMFIDGGSSPEMIRCSFIANAVRSGNGGAVISAHPSNDVTFLDCSFADNDAPVFGGAIRNFGGTLDARRCRFERNTSGSLGGAVYRDAGGSMVLVDSTFVANTTGVDGGAVYITGTPVTIVNCAFFRNQAGGYGGAVSATSAPVVLVNCLFDGNRADGNGAYARSGAALANRHGVLSATNCTFANNAAVRSGGNSNKGNGGGFYHGVWNTRSKLDNCVFWGNTDGGETIEGAQIFVDPQSHAPPVVTHSLIHGLVPGGNFDSGFNINNIGDDPLFDDEVGTDGIIGTEDDSLRLTFGSPCIGAGSNAAVPSDAADVDEDGNVLEPVPIDLDGQPRFGECVVEMGAYEFAGGPPGAIPSDFDGDCDVDLADHAFLELCLSVSGPSAPTIRGCESADLDADGHVGLRDFGLLQRCFSGKDIPGDQNCAR